ncbi:hypothetical protein AKN40_1449 [Escherichia coli]|nr:hypothetical protein AKN40_1449 [Escherichia coli]
MLGIALAGAAQSIMLVASITGISLIGISILVSQKLSISKLRQLAPRYLRYE